MVRVKVRVWVWVRVMVGNLTEVNGANREFTKR